MLHAVTTQEDDRPSAEASEDKRCARSPPGRCNLNFLAVLNDVVAGKAGSADQCKHLTFLKMISFSGNRRQQAIFNSKRAGNLIRV